MFITVVHGDNQRSLFNIQCKMMALLDCIKLKCDCNPEDEIGLADMNGQVTVQKSGVAADILTQTGEYVLISCSSGQTQPVVLNECGLHDLLSLAILQGKENERKPFAFAEACSSDSGLPSSLSKSGKLKTSKRIRFSSACTE